MKIQERIRKLNEDGFILIPNVISDFECNFYKKLLEEDYIKYSGFYDGNKRIDEGKLSDKSGEKVVYNLHNKHISWFKLFEHKDVLSLLDIILKSGSYKDEEPYYLNNISARCPRKGFGKQQLHLDSNLPGVNYTLIVNVVWLLDDFTIENGATRVVPGSHKKKSFAADGENHEDEIFITGSKGSVIIFNANLWHGGAENTTDETRWAVLLGYARWFIKPSFDFMKNTPTSIFKELSNEQKSLLGFDLNAPKYEFTRIRRRSSYFEEPTEYKLPDISKDKK